MSATVCIIEDDLPISEMYAFKLRQSGYTVHTANNGKSGLELVEHIRPHLVLLDLKLPEMTGEDMLQQMRATDWGANIKVIILTNISKDEAPQKLRLLNVERYIVKAHYTPRQMVETIEEVLK